jgi:hypothetical protein
VPWRSSRTVALPRGERFEDYLEQRWPIRDWHHEWRTDSVRVRARPALKDPPPEWSRVWSVEWWDRHEWQWLGDLEPRRRPLRSGRFLYIVRA